MHQKIITKLKATTLVEVMVALALTSFATTLAVVIYLNIQQSTLPFFKIRAAEQAQRCLNETIQTKDFFDKQVEQNDFILKKKIIKNAHYPDCIDINIKIFDANKKKLVEIQTTVYAE